MLMEKFDLPDDMPLQLKPLSRIIEQAQSKVEGLNFDLRKHLLDYDDVLNKQRLSVYRERQKFLENLTPENLGQIIFESTNPVLEKILLEREEFIKNNPNEKILSLKEFIEKLFYDIGLLNKDESFSIEPNIEDLKKLLSKKSFEVAFDPQTKNRMLGILDSLWVDHLETLDALLESIGLRAYGQKDPLVEYRREAHKLFLNFWDNFNQLVFSNVFKLADRKFVSSDKIVKKENNENLNFINKKVGRNDLCPCGSGKKYKKCHGK